MARLFGTDLKQGAKGPAVKVLAIALVGLGFGVEGIVADEDYTVGGKIAESVKRFQAEMHIDQTGDFDVMTQRLFEARMAFDISAFTTEMFPPS